MEYEKNFTRAVFLIPFWLMYGEAIAAWETAFDISIKAGPCVLFLILLSLLYSLSFLFVPFWKNSIRLGNGLFLSLLIIMPLFGEIRGQIRHLFSAVNQLCHQAYGMRVVVSSELRDKADCSLALFWLVLLFFFISLYFFWKDSSALCQILPGVLLFLVPVVSDGEIPYHATICFFCGMILSLMGIGRRGKESLPAFGAGLSLLIVCLLCISLFFPENLYHSLLEEGGDKAVSGEEEQDEKPVSVEILQGEFDPDGRIEYEDVTMFRLTLPARPAYVPYIFLKSFEGTTYKDGRWIGKSSRHNISYFGEFSRMNSNTWEIERVSGREDVVPYGDESPYNVETGKVLRANGAWRSYQTPVCRMERHWEERLGYKITQENGHEDEKEIPNLIRNICKKQLKFVKADTYQELTDEIKKFFQEEYQYTQNPGKPEKNKDELLYFARDSKRGYCVHFTSLAVYMFRSRGIPARYAQGYSLNTSELRINHAFSVKDYMAHAWVEIYIKGAWVPVDVTPGHSGDYYGLGSGGSYNGQSAKPGQALSAQAVDADFVQEKEEGEDTHFLKKSGVFLFVLFLFALLFPAGWYLSQLIRREWMFHLRKRGDWQLLFCKLHAEFLRYLNKRNVVWEEMSREETVNNIFYAFSPGISFVYEKEMHEFQMETAWYVNEAFAIRYGEETATKDDLLRALRWYKRILGRQKHFVFSRAFQVFRRSL